VARRIDLRPNLGIPKSQGMRSTCLAFAASAAHEISLFAEHDIIDTCEEFLYWASKQHDTPGPGTTFPAVRDGFADHGQPTEDVWPYDGSRNDEDPTYSPPADAHTAQPRWSPTLAAVTANPSDVRALLDAGLAVVLGIPTWPAFDTPTAGRLAVPHANDLDGAYHAVSVIGYDEITAEMLIRNSWGPGWGDNGSVWIPLRFLDIHDCEAWILGKATDPSTTATTLQSAPRYGSSERAN
jgi:C1A family cysteine protease